MVPYSRASLIEGGAASGAAPQLRFGVGPMTSSSLPPATTEACVNQGLSSGLPSRRAELEPRLTGAYQGTRSRYSGADPIVATTSAPTW